MNNIRDGAFRTPKECSTGGVFNCVAVAITPAGVAVRDTKDATKTTLSFSCNEWAIFVEAVKQGQFNIKV